MYHAHVYFDLSEQNQAQSLQQKILAEQSGQILRLFSLVPRLVGPHRKPMFEIHFSEQQSDFIDWLDKARGELSVLIHPVSGNDINDHSEPQVRWLGAKLGVNLDKLR
ncbi:DOPA 4,5-dioxygenase family protein [Vibrio cincinnatiensis]|uniref:DOPA 4,5-dioxygenase family protein n=1 Tax=Vibrio cincinnatiensis TaxID=675 RepID=UPI0012ACCC34|nr:DOPA 4,5-dioxygenase family protein [Vibrio cincinnatiensis]